jgi:hypothetical protein
LSRITNGEENMNLDKKFPDAHLFSFQIDDEYFTYIIHYLSTGIAP